MVRQQQFRIVPEAMSASKQQCIAARIQSGNGTGAGCGRAVMPSNTLNILSHARFSTILLARSGIGLPLIVNTKSNGSYHPFHIIHIRTHSTVVVDGKVCMG
jgi:hypothetical protein